MSAGLFFIVKRDGCRIYNKLIREISIVICIDSNLLQTTQMTSLVIRTDV